MIVQIVLTASAKIWGALRREAQHLLTKAEELDPAEDLSTVLAHNECLTARQQLLERVSDNPIMNDLFTVINLQVARLLTGNPQHPPSTSPCQQPAGQQPLGKNPAEPAGLGDFGTSQQKRAIAEADHAGSPHPSRQQHAFSIRQHRGSELLPQAVPPASLPQHGKSRQPLKPIPEDHSQGLGVAATQADAPEQRDLIHTPSQDSAEGALMDLESTTPHPACVLRSSTATSAVKRPAEWPPRTPRQPASAPMAAHGKLPATVSALPSWQPEHSHGSSDCPLPCPLAPKAKPCQ